MRNNLTVPALFMSFPLSGLLFLDKERSLNWPMPSHQNSACLGRGSSLCISIFSHFSSVNTHYYLFLTPIWQVSIMEIAMVGGKIRTGEKSPAVFQTSVYILSPWARLLLQWHNESHLLPWGTPLNVSFFHCKIGYYRNEMGQHMLSP